MQTMTGIRSQRKQAAKAHKVLSGINGKSSIVFESIALVTRERIAQSIADHSSDTLPRRLDRLAGPLSAFVQMLRDHFPYVYISAWTVGMDEVARLFPPWLQHEFRTGIRSRHNPEPPNEPPRSRWPRFPMFDDDDELRFPLIEAAAEKLANRDVMTRAQWDAANRYAMDRAFFITENIEPNAIEAIRDVLVDQIQSGASLRSFEKQVEESLGNIPISSGHLENVYRTNIQAAFRDGHETLLSDPTVSGVFPYQAYFAIHDGRVRHDHQALESLGLNGTNVYRRDDPFWDYFTPPWDYQCRCSVVAMTIESAAMAGVEEAKEWLRTGKPPYSPEWRLPEVLKVVQPNPTFGQRGLVHAA
jgi:SPP1 gp7 family putative phage head morphogenesis protein